MSTLVKALRTKILRHANCAYEKFERQILMICDGNNKMNSYGVKIGTKSQPAQYPMKKPKTYDIRYSRLSKVFLGYRAKNSNQNAESEREVNP